MDDLALQIGQRDNVVIDHAELAYAGGSEIHQRWRAQAAGADHQHGGLFQRGLAGSADFAQHDMAGIAFDLVGAQHRLTGFSGSFLEPRRGCCRLSRCA